MINIEKTKIYGIEEAVRGVRNSWNSWDRSDSDGDILGKNDYVLLKNLCKSKSERKFARFITVTVDISAPLYWWKEFDQYKVGTTTLSCSTMHTLTKEKLSIDMFATEFLSFQKENFEYQGNDCLRSSFDIFEYYLAFLNRLIDKVNETGNAIYWRQIIQMLPSSYIQKRTVSMNYEVLMNIYKDRKNHKLFEWRELCKWIEGLKYSDLIQESNSKEVK